MNTFLLAVAAPVLVLLSRHPNYFGEATIWWSFAALGLVHPWGWLALVCPLYVTWFMSAGCDVSGEVLVCGGGLVRRAGAGETAALRNSRGRGNDKGSLKPDTMRATFPVQGGLS